MGPASRRWLPWRLLGGVAGASLLAPTRGVATPGPSDGLFNFIRESKLADPPIGVMLCTFGFAEHFLDLARRVLGEFAPPDFRAHVAFFRIGDEHRAGRGDTFAALAEDFPDRFHMADDLVPFDGLCSMSVLSMEDPRFTSEDLLLVGRRSGMLLAYVEPPAACQVNFTYACRFFHRSWEAMVDAKSPSCSQNFCVTELDPDDLRTGGVLDDQLLAGVECPALTGVAAPLSESSQWQQDWFVYQNFIRGTPMDTRPGGGGRKGVFVDIGAFHPVHLSNTVFFDRCLGWQGVCVEPNPNWGPYFHAYRPRCKLMRNCVWSRPRDVVMTFEKDPIEAYIQRDGSSDDSSSGAVLINTSSASAKPSFTAHCRTLEDILSSSGLRRPAIIDYLSVDAEAAEVEIFRSFPFDQFDIRVVSVEVQAKNYYDLDVVFSVAGYAKVAVLGGDHVYAKLTRGLDWPDGAAEWHAELSRDFYAHRKPQTAMLTS